MDKQIEIIPAILPQDYAEIEEKVAQIKGLVKTVQIDVCDGHFVNSFTWPYKKKDNNFEMLIREEIALPDWEELDYEFDLMVNNPENVVDDWVSLGATRIVIHAESKGNVEEAIEKLQGKVEIGLALNIDTDIQTIKTFVEKIQFIQLMGIDHVGFQGQNFDNKVLDKIAEVREAFPDMIISIDGGVSMETAGDLLDAGADRLIVGSAIFNNDNVVQAVMDFQGL